MDIAAWGLAGTVSVGYSASSFIVQAAASCRPPLGQVQELLLREQPDLVHVLAAPREPTTRSRSAESDRETGQDESDTPFAQGLIALFGELQKAVQWIVLDGCWDRDHAAAMAAFVDCVIGTPAELSGECATGFSRLPLS